MRQRQSFSVDDRPALIHIAQKIPDILHVVQPVIPDAKGKRGIFASISVVQHRTQADGRLERLVRFLRNLQIALEHPPCIPVASGRTRARRLAEKGDHGGGKVLAAANVGEARAGAADVQPAVLSSDKLYRVVLAAADGAADVQFRIGFRTPHIRDPALPVVFHPALIIGGGKQCFYLTQIHPNTPFYASPKTGRKRPNLAASRLFVQYTR